VSAAALCVCGVEPFASERLTSCGCQLQALAEHGAHVIIASRSLDRSQAAAEKIMVRCCSVLSVLEV
jgi:hypothetical protein